LDYPGVGPELSYWNDQQRIQYVAVQDTQAVEGMQLLAETEGIIPALESAHAVTYAVTLVPQLPADTIVVINISGRGDKDLQSVARFLGESGV
jgi:tryptophan synthase beta chain